MSCKSLFIINHTVAKFHVYRYIVHQWYHACPEKLCKGANHVAQRACTSFIAWHEHFLNSTRNYRFKDNSNNNNDKSFKYALLSATHMFAIHQTIAGLLNFLCSWYKVLQFSVHSFSSVTSFGLREKLFCSALLTSGSFLKVCDISNVNWTPWIDYMIII